jgi:uncharacterized protein
MRENVYRDTRYRVIAVVVYALLLAFIQWRVVVTGFEPNENAIWLYSGFASLLFGSRLLNPHFTPPADAATNGFVGLSGIVAGSLVVVPGTLNSWLLWSVAAFCGLVCVVAIVVLLVRTPIGVETRRWVRTADRAVRGLGSPTVIFTILVLACVWLFHRPRPDEVMAILMAWAVIVVLRPVEVVFGFWAWLSEQRGEMRADNVIGPIAAYQSPGIVLVRQVGASSITQGTPLVVADGNGTLLLGVSLNYVGRDEGNLLRVLTVPLPNGLKQRISHFSYSMDTGVAIALSATPEELVEVPAIQWICRLCGVVGSHPGSAS